MISKKKQRIRWLISAIILIFIATLIIGFSLKDGIEYYKSPTQVLDHKISENIKFRLGGLVESDSLIKSSGKKIFFKITDNENSILTSYEGILPDLFAENQGVIASGKYINGVFVAEEILAKHDESYLPKEVIEILKQCFDPEIPVDIYELGLIYDVFVNEDFDAKVLMTLTSPNCPVAESLPAEVEQKVKSIKGINQVEVEMTFDPPWTKDLMSEEAKLELGFL